MIKTEDNYYRIMLETAWKYPKRILDGMDDEECENEYVVNKGNQLKQ